MDDEEIDRIFHDATRSCESPPLSTLPSPPESITNNTVDMRSRVTVEDPYDWQYKLPSPPKAFRDQTNSPTTTTTATTEYNTVTVANLINTSREMRLPSAETGLTEVESKLTIFKNDTTKNVDREESRRSNDCDKFIENSGTENLTKNQKLGQNIERRVYGDEKLINCEKSPYNEINYGSTNDSGLGSDDSIPSVSECKIASREQIFVKKASDKRESGLNNFTITTYQNSKPTDIFRDESVKTSKTTRLAENSRPYVKSRYEKKEEKSSNSLSRRSSFNVERTSGSSIKRSKSHISVLSGNFSKFNQLGYLNANGYVNDNDDSPVESGHDNSSIRSELEKKLRAQSLPNALMSPLRKSTSECSITKDTDKDEEEMLELRDQVLKWKENDKSSDLTGPARNAAELQSLQVLKDILPHINKQRPSTLMQTAISNTQNDSTSQIRAVEKSKSSAVRVPTVNLQSWSERPKRQISIKTDRDYVFGKVKEKLLLDENQKFITNNIIGNKIKTEFDNRVNIYVNCKSDSNENASRVPVVRAVAFKKPLVQNCVNGTTSYHNEPVSAPTVIMNGNRDEKLSSKITKTRPGSFYLYGECIDSSYDRVSAKDRTYSINNNKSCVRLSQGDCQPNKPKTDLERDDNYCRSTITSGDINKKYFTDGSNYVNSTSNKKENFTFKTYKMKFMENEKALSNGKRCSDFECHGRQNSGEKNSSYNGKTVVNINGELNDDSAEGQFNGKFSTFGRSYEDSASRCNGTKPSVIVVSSSATSSVPPPAPPLMKTAPIGASARACANKKINWSKSNVNDNPRDVLLSSIKNFNRDNLRKLRVK